MPSKGNKRKLSLYRAYKKNDNWMKLYLLFKFSYSRFSVSINFLNAFFYREDLTRVEQFN